MCCCVNYKSEINTCMFKPKEPLAFLTSKVSGVCVWEGAGFEQYSLIFYDQIKRSSHFKTEVNPDFCAMLNK